MQPAAWTSLRERHSNAGPSPAGADAGLQPGGDSAGGPGDTAGRLTAQQQLVAALGSGVDQPSSGKVAVPPEAQALPPALSFGDSVSGRAVSFGLPTLAAGVAGALTVDSAANLADATKPAPGSASAAENERAPSSQLIRSLSFGGLAPGSVSNVNTPAVSAGGANVLLSSDGAGSRALAAPPPSQRLSLDAANTSVGTASMHLQQPSGAGERGGIGSLTFVNPLFDPAHPEDSSNAAAQDTGSNGGQSAGTGPQHDDGAVEDSERGSDRELKAAVVDEEEQEFIEEDIPEAESAGEEEPAMGQVMTAQVAAPGEASASREATEEAPQAVASSPQGTAGSGSARAGLFRQQSWGSSAAGLAGAAGAGTGSAPPPVVDSAGEAAGGAALDERPIVTAAARFMSSPGGPAQGPPAAAVERGFASAGGVGGNFASPPPQTPAEGDMHTPWMDAATAAAAAGSGALLRVSPGSAAATAAAAASQGGASGYSGMSAALVGSVPQQDREERVRSWAQTEADFAAMPMGSGSNGGAGPPPEAGSLGGGMASAAAEMPSDAASMMTRAAAAAAAAGLAIPGAPLGAGRASSAAAAPKAATACQSSPAAGVHTVAKQLSPCTESAPAPKDSLEARMAQVLQSTGTEASPEAMRSAGGAAKAAGEASSPATSAAAAPAQSAMPVITHASGGSGSAMSVTAAAEAALAALIAATAAAQQDRPIAGVLHNPAAPAVNTQQPQPVAAHVAADTATVSQPAPSPGAAAVQGAEARAKGAEGVAATESDAAMDADLDRLLSMLSGRGARSEAHMRLGFDSFRSAVVTAAIAPRPRSAPGIAKLAAAMAEAAAEVAAEEEEQRHQQHSPAAAATAMSVRTSGLPGHASMAASVGGNSPRSPLDVSGRLVAFAAASAERGSAQLPTLSRISAGVSSRAHPDAESAAAAPSSAVRPTSSITLQPHPAPVHHQSHHQLNLPGHTGAQVRGSGLPEHPHPHLQPHLPLHPHLHMHPSVGNSASAGGTHHIHSLPQPLSTTASLASIDSEVREPVLLWVGFGCARIPWVPWAPHFTAIAALDAACSFLHTFSQCD